MSTTTNEPSGAEAPEATTKTRQAEKPWSFRPGRDTAIRKFLQDLLEQFNGSPQAVMHHCITRAMASEPITHDSSFDDMKRANLDMQRQIADLKAQLEKKPTNKETSIALDPVDEQWLNDSVVRKKNTTRDEAIKFCVKYTRKNILFI